MIGGIHQRDRASRLARAALLLLACVALGACHAFAPETQDEGFALSSGSQFALRSIETEGDPHFGPNAQRAAAVALVAGLEARGLVQVDERADADFVVTLGSALETALGFGDRTDALDEPVGLEVRRFTVDFHDAANDRRVWRGVGGAHFEAPEVGEAREIDEVRVAEAIDQILTRLR